MSVKKGISVVLIAATSLMLGACSTSIKVDDNENGTCTQERKSHFIGIPYKTDRNFVNCDIVE